MTRPGTALLSAVLLLACGEGTSGPTPNGDLDLSLEWQTASPASQDIDPGAITSAINHARGLPRILSLLVVRNGFLVVEQYFNGNKADSLNDGRSVTKSVLSTLVGAAVRQGLLTGVDTRLDALVPATYLDQLSAAKRAITVRDLLTMSSGFEWHENDGVLPANAEYNGWVLSSDPVAYLLARPLIATPGTIFTYNSAGTHLLSVLLTTATGPPLAEFARESVFDPLGIPEARWETFPDGTPNGGSGLKLRPRDFAKIGALWLNDGSTGRMTILDPGDVASGTSPRFGYWAPAPPPLSSFGYGYSWWTARTGPGDGFFAWGFGGQFIFVVPVRSLVVVVTTEWRGAGAQAPQQEFNALDLIVNHVLPAVH
jgi:CubicO group peptidase (beta-lactamase class C family)